VGLPFTVEQFFGVFRAYNVAVWPAQPVLLALGVLLVVLALRRPDAASRLIAAVLAFLWAWMGIAYHLLFFAAINPVARVFGAFFLLQAALLLAFGVARRRLAFARVSPARTAAGSALAAYALVGYPALGWLAGHRYPGIPTFGVPCPTTILTLALLLFVRPPFPWSIAVIPLLWSAVGSTAAFALGVPQDLGLLAAGVVVLGAWLPPRRRPNAAA
jgi:hypothetical protein